MTHLTKKSLKETLVILQSFETYSIYQAVDNAMGDLDAATKRKVLSKLQEASAVENGKIIAAKSWLEAILIDSAT